IYFFVNTQERNMDFESWKSTFGNSIEFPFSFINIDRLEEKESKVEICSDLNTNTIKIIYEENSSEFFIQCSNTKSEELLLRFTCFIKQKDLTPSVGIKTIKAGISDE